MIRTSGPKHSLLLLFIISASLLSGGWASASGEDAPQARKAARELLTFLRAASRHDLDPASKALNDHQREVRRSALAAGEPGLIALEEVGEPLLRYRWHHSSGYFRFWHSYIRACAIDNPEAGRPRLGAFLARADLPIGTKVCFLSVLAEPMLDASDWLPDEVVLDILEELFEHQKVVGDLLVVRGMDEKDKAYHLLKGPVFATTTIQDLYAPENVSWPIFGSPDDPLIQAQRSAAVENAHRWVAARRLRIRLKESLLEALSQHRAVGLTDSKSLATAFDLLATLVERTDRSDLKRLMFAYLDHAALHGTASHDAVYQEHLGSVIVRLCRSMGQIEAGATVPPTNPTIEDARIWLELLLKACKEKSAHSYLLQREWLLIAEAIAGH